MRRRIVAATFGYRSELEATRGWSRRVDGMHKSVYG